MKQLGHRALVLGASMSGLMTARVLSDFYGEVVIVERDELTDGIGHRRGVPQGRHVHVLLPRCAQILAEHFPGILNELVEQGVPHWNDGNLKRLSMSILGHPTTRDGYLTDHESMPHYYPSRPRLESTVRRRVGAIANVTVLGGHDVLELSFTANADRVTGARLIRRDDGSDQELTADLVVDATGRGSRTPVFLDGRGYGKPREDALTVKLTYASHLIRMPEELVRGTIGTAVFPEPGRPTTLAISRIENDLWLLTIGAMCGRPAPQTTAEILSAAMLLAPSHLADGIRSAEPVGELHHHRVPSNRWRRYDALPRVPDGLVVVGDAICSFNPIYGQGMTLAAIESTILRDCLNRGTDNLPRRFFRASARQLRIAWRTTVGSDLALPEVEGRRSLAVKISNAYIERVLTAAETDPVVVTQFMRVVGMLDSPLTLVRPSIVVRIVRRRPRGRPKSARDHQQLPA